MKLQDIKYLFDNIDDISWDISDDILGITIVTPHIDDIVNIWLLTKFAKKYNIKCNDNMISHIDFPILLKLFDIIIDLLNNSFDVKSDRDDVQRILFHRGTEYAEELYFSLSLINCNQYGIVDDETFESYLDSQ